MSRVYGLHPWDTDRLTDGEWQAYLNDVRKVT